MNDTNHPTAQRLAQAERSFAGLVNVTHGALRRLTDEGVITAAEGNGCLEWPGAQPPENPGYTLNGFDAAALTVTNLLGLLGQRVIDDSHKLMAYETVLEAQGVDVASIEYSVHDTAEEANAAAQAAANAGAPNVAVKHFG